MHAKRIVVCRASSVDLALGPRNVRTGPLREREGKGRTEGGSVVWEKKEETREKKEKEKRRKKEMEKEKNDSFEKKRNKKNNRKR